MRHQSHRLDQGLCSEKAVSGIGMMRRQVFDAGSVLGLDVQILVTGFAQAMQGALAGHGHVATSRAVLDGDLPNGGHADPDD